MPQPPQFPTAAASSLPCPEALLTGAMAFMTAHAQACCAAQRMRMTRQAIAALSLLARHPSLSPEFRAALVDLDQLWHGIQDEADLAQEAAPAASALVH